MRFDAKVIITPWYDDSIKKNIRGIIIIPLNRIEEFKLWEKLKYAFTWPYSTAIVTSNLFFKKVLLT